MLLQPRQLTPQVPFDFPPISFLKLQDYLTTLVNANGGVYWPLDDAVNNPFNRVINPATAIGRELCINGGFDADATWTKGSGATISGGLGHVNVVGSVTAFSQTIQSTIGRAYRLTVTVSNYVSGIVQFKWSGSPVITNLSANGTFTVDVICNNSGLVFLTAASAQMDIDNVSVKELNIPASTATPTQLLDTAPWVSGLQGTWAAGNSATITFPTTTLHDGSTGKVIRVARNGVANPQIQITSMSVGSVYRVYGWFRSDGSATPLAVINGGTSVAGTASTDWQPYDYVGVAPSTGSGIFFLRATTNTGTQFCEFDVTVVALDTGIRQGNTVQNGTFDADASWSKQAGWTISGGKGVGTTVTSGNSLTQNSIVVAGKRYLLTYDLVVTSGTARFGGGFTGVIQSASGSYSEVINPTSSSFQFISITTFTGTIDNIVVTELSPLVAVPVNGAVLGNAESNRLLESVSFDGVNDFLNMYSAQLNSIFPTDEGSLIIFEKYTGSWTDGVARIMATFGDNGTLGRVQLAKNNSNNLLFCTYNGKNFSPAFTSALYNCLAITWSKSNDQAILYINGVQSGSILTGLTAWTSNLTSTLNTVGANGTGGANPFTGSMSQVIVVSRALSVSEIAEIAKLGDAA